MVAQVVAAVIVQAEVTHPPVEGVAIRIQVVVEVDFTPTTTIVTTIHIRRMGTMTGTIIRVPIVDFITVFPV